MSIFELWLLVTVVPSAGSAIGILFVLLTIAVPLAWFLYMPISDICETKTADSYYSFLKSKTKIAVIIWVVLLIVSAILPSERQMLLIAGGYTATNNEQIKQLPTNAAKAVTAWLDAVTKAAEVEEKK